MASAATSAEILRHTAAFTSETLSQSKPRLRLLSVLRRKLSTSDKNVIRQLNIAAETLENAISTSSSSNRSASLRHVERLLHSHSDTLFSSFLLSLLYTLLNRPIEAAHSLLDMFSSDPLFARSEIAPVLFEELFIVQLLPVLQSFKGQRSRILASLSSKNLGYYRDEKSRFEQSAVVSGTRLLSKMSGGQTSELKELERDYEQVLDENCRLLVGYFREVLGDENGSKLIRQPSLILQKTVKSEECKCNEDGQSKVGEIELRNCGYNNVMLSSPWFFFSIILILFSSFYCFLIHSLNKQLDIFFPDFLGVPY